jgi:MFS family permease
VAALLGGALSDWARSREGGRGVMRYACVAAIAALFLTSFAIMPEPRLVIAVLFFQSIASSLCSVICIVAIQITLPNELRGLASALISVGNVLLGLGCGPTLVALVSERVFRGPNALGLSLLTVTAVAFVAAASLLMGERWRCRSRPTSESGDRGFAL